MSLQLGIGLQIGRVRIGSKLNYYQVGEAWNDNNVNDIDNIYYKLNGTDYEIYAIVPTLSKKALYDIGVALDGFMYLRGSKIGDLAFGDLIAKNYDSKTGAWVDGTAATAYATGIGATITATFVGNKVEFRSYSNTSGGLWSFSIDGGEPILLSVYRSSSGYIEQLVSDELSGGEHTIVGTFVGQDPNNPIGSPRGWARLDRTFNVYQIEFSNESNIQTNSLNEMAITIESYKAPYHGTVSLTPISREIKIDGVAVSDFTAGQILECVEIEINAVYEQFDPDNVSDKLATYTFKQIINKKGYAVYYDIEAIRAVSITGYPFMLSIDRSFGTLLTTNLGHEYDITDSDGVYDEILNVDSVRSMKVTSNLVGKTDIQLTAAILGISAIRPGAVDRNDPVAFIQNRDDLTLQKVYWYTLYNTQLGEGAKLSFRNIYYVGEM